MKLYKDAKIAVNEPYLYKFQGQKYHMSLMIPEIGTYFCKHEQKRKLSQIHKTKEKCSDGD